MTTSRRNFLRDSAQMLTAVPLLGAAAPMLGAPPPAGIDYSLLTKPFVGKKVSAKDIKREGRRLFRERNAAAAEQDASSSVQKRVATSRKSTPGSRRTKIS